MIGYLNQKNKTKLSFAPPETYQKFYDLFLEFKEDFNLVEYTNYQLDKYLWQYGKNVIGEIVSNEGVKLNKAKSILKKRIASC